MLSAFALALAQLGDRALRRPILHTMLWSVVVFAALWAVMAWLVDRAFVGQPLVEWLAGIFGVLLAPVATWFLFPGVAITILGFYSESVIRAVEARHYPNLPPAPPESWLSAIRSSLRIVLLSLLLNCLALPFYLLVPGVNLVLFLAVNGYLLGREYFDLVALRRVEWRAARAVWYEHRMMFVAAGAVIAGLSAIPVLNLIAPIVATAATVHLVERARRTASAPAAAR
jgi:CysZ protein